MYETYFRVILFYLLCLVKQAGSERAANFDLPMMAG
jgi:hypothetical protein